MKIPTPHSSMLRLDIAQRRRTERSPFFPMVVAVPSSFLACRRREAARRGEGGRLSRETFRALSWLVLKHVAPLRCGFLEARVINHVSHGSGRIHIEWSTLHFSSTPGSLTTVWRMRAGRKQRQAQQP